MNRDLAANSCFITGMIDPAGTLPGKIDDLDPVRVLAHRIFL